MNVGRRVDYALRALCYLAGQRQPASCHDRKLKSDSDSSALPVEDSARTGRCGPAGFSAGRAGGFRLGRLARDISVRAVFESVEGHCRS